MNAKVRAAHVPAWYASLSAPTLVARTGRLRTMQRQEEWWVNEIEALRPNFEKFAFRRLGGSSRADDVVEDSIVSILEALRTKKQEYPAAWFGERQPPSESVEEFHGFAWTILKRRVHDMLRKRYRELNRLGHRSAELSEEDREAPAPEVDARVDATRFLNLLLARVEGLSSADRDALAEALVHEEALSPVARQRLSRVRKKLTQAMAAQLGEAAKGKGKSR
jgi:DNA-directed RNA polymerase specialized sigma24 family protein